MDAMNSCMDEPRSCSAQAEMAWRLLFLWSSWACRAVSHPTCV
ncbi:hypothetical protein O4J56_23825 [Nocardiopsis sp. RSe5-2]|uniref:Uncharacterized protein n=1 Tax=Nocardiopsis endophytica TaxID=3018445 RepID=A0ABT4UB50_9ACTN|nr:hypothetical protein [Nocardiopsis endophytica]MDA2813694.1 hypothetical protein [Nocardiopsis endophytica]